MVDQKKSLSEEDIKFRYITPAITNAKWEPNDIRFEYPITDGQIKINGNKAVREKPKKADYVLFFNSTIPLAVVEAKDNSHTVEHGIQQALEYAIKLGAPFAYSSNGDAFLEHDFLTGKERTISLDQFPSQTELYERFKQDNKINNVQDKLIHQQFYTAQGVFEPRYYQRRASNEAINAIGQGKDRVLLVLATGTGKTYIAFQTIYRLLKTKVKKRVLYLADRNILVDQSIQQDFAPLKKDIHKLDVSKDKKELLNSYTIFFSLYQQLVGKNGDEDHYSKLFNPNFFDLIFIDECHRGSAKEDSAWRKILEYFSSATQIGMTATPKETKYASNISYFGDPVYTYSLKDGIEDGFLAPFKVIRYVLNIGDGWRPTAGQKDKFGNVIEDREYNNSDYDVNIIIEDRTRLVAQEVSKYLRCTDEMAKTIVFTPTEEAASRMRTALINENSDLVKEHPDYVVRITGSEPFHEGMLKRFISVGEKYPVIATTSKLLSTGVDCKMVKVIVLDEMIGSMTEFKQIIGRGTRIREQDGKTHFVVLDFRNVTRLFADPDWDGPVEVDPGFVPGNTPPKPKDPPKPVDLPYKPVIDENGCRAEIWQKEVSLYDAEGNLLKRENIIDYTKKNIMKEYASLEVFISSWSKEQKKEKIRDMLLEKGIDLELLKQDQNMSQMDDFDFICHLAYDRKPLTRKERAEGVKKQDFFAKYSNEAKQILEALLDKYMNEGIYEIESADILKLEPFNQYGRPAAIARLFGGKDEYFHAVSELENAIYAYGEA